MMKKNLKKTSISIVSLFLLSGCQISYSHPITQSDAKEIVRKTKEKINEKDYKEFSKIYFESKLTEEKSTSFFNSLFLEMTYKFEYVANPFSINIEIKSSNKENKELAVKSGTLSISKTDTAYLVSLNGGEKEDINQEKYKDYWSFCDFSLYIKSISQKLISKTFNLIDSVGNANENKTNKLVGFQTSSSGNLNLNIAFEGSEFDAKDLFFEANYNAETATVLSVNMDNGLINKYSSEYAFTVNETDDYYLAGKYEGKIINTIKYE